MNRLCCLGLGKNLAICRIGIGEGTLRLYSLVYLNSTEQLLVYSGRPKQAIVVQNSLFKDFK